MALLALVVTLLLAAFPATVGATPPEEVSFTTDTLYSIGNFSSVEGTWDNTSDNALMGGGGDVDEAHAEAGWSGPNIHVISTLSESDGADTITMRIQIKTEPSGRGFGGTGQWVIVAGTGVYANLHGHGTVEMTATVDLSAGENGEIDVHLEYTGSDHFDPAR